MYFIVFKMQECCSVLVQPKMKNGHSRLASISPSSAASWENTPPYSACGRWESGVIQSWLEGLGFLGRSFFMVSVNPARSGIEDELPDARALEVEQI
jgi:hypothetical protein